MAREFLLVRENRRHSILPVQAAVAAEAAVQGVALAFALVALTVAVAILLLGRSE